MKNFRSVLLLCTLLHLAEHTLAIGKPFARHITISDGLPSNVVYDVYEDSKGFIWFCTDQGISRYDGTSFLNYSIKEGIPDREVFRIREDSQGRYWLVCYNRKACYLKHGKIYTSKNDFICRQIEANDVSYDELFVDRNGKECLVGRRVAILSSQPPSLSIIENITLPGGRLQHFRAHDEDYIIANNRVYNINTGRYQKMDYNQAASFDGNSLFISSLIGAKKALCQWKFSGDSLYLRKKIYLSDRLYQIGPFEKDGIKLCTSSGIMVYDILSDKIIPDPNFPTGIKANNMRIDRYGNRWITTLNDGIYFLPKNAGTIIDQESGLLKNNILSVSLGSGGGIIAGDDDGHVYRINDNSTQIYTVTTKKGENRVLFARQGLQGIVMAGADDGLYAIEGSSVSYIQYSISMKAGIFSGRYFYAGSTLGLLVYDTYNKTANMESTNRITALTIDEDQRLWVGGIRGLDFYENGKPQKYNFNNQLSESFITSIAPAPGGGILAGSSSQGLFVIKNHRLPPVNLNIKRGLSGNSCKKIFVSENGCIWVCSEGGIDRIFSKTEGRYIIKPFPLPFSLTGNQINDLTEHNGFLYLATSKGIVVINSQDTIQLPPPHLYIETVNDQTFTGQQFRFKSGERNLQVLYTGLSYSGGTPLQYKYVLSGSTNDTLYTNAQAINFSKLSPGDYNLMIWCRSAESAWTARPVKLSFTILPPFWRHPLSISIFVIVICSAVTALFMYRINKVKKHAAQEAHNQQQLAELEMNALRAQINPHFIFNALNAIQLYYSKNDEITANHYMTSFAQFIRLTLEYSKAHWLPLSEEISMLHTYLELEQIRFQHLFTITIDVSQELSTKSVAIPAMLIQPYVENAVNHGLRYLNEPNGKILLSFSIQKDNLCCIIDDNGIGRKLSAAYKQLHHSSMGMNITHQRIEAINRMYSIKVTVEIIDKLGSGDRPEGTKVILRTPLKFVDDVYDHTNS